MTTRRTAKALRQALAARVVPPCRARDTRCPECDPTSRRAATRSWWMPPTRISPRACCDIFVGSFGVHKFILGFTTAGVIMLVISS